MNRSRTSHWFLLGFLSVMVLLLIVVAVGWVFWGIR